MCHVDGTVTSNSEQLMDRNRSGGTINGVGQDLDVDVRLGADHRREIWGEMRTSAVPATVFAFLTDASQMMTWLAQSAKADARPGGIFRLADLNGLWVEGTYVAATPHQRVVFTWGGIEGLRPGQCTVEFALHADVNGTLLRPPFRPPRSGGRRASARLEELGAVKIEGCCGGRITTRDLLKGRCGVTRTASIFGGSLLVNLFECYSSLFVISDGV